MGFNRRPIDALDLVIGMSKAAQPLIHNNCTPQAMYEAMLDVIAAAPEVLLEQKWTPVSEPPEENGYYLCYVLTSANGNKAVYEQMKLFWEDDIWLYRHNSYRMCRNVTHWAHLPAPPKEVTTDGRPNEDRSR